MANPSRIWRAWGAPVVLCVTVLAFVAGASSLSTPLFFIHTYGSTVRWIGLFVACGLGLALAVSARGRVRGFVLLPGTLLALAVLSTTWSATPLITFEKTGSLGVLFVMGAALAHGSRNDPVLRRRIVLAPAVAAVVAAVVGLLMLLVGDNDAVQQATSSSPWRFRGVGENPNTIPVLAAVALPAAVWAALRARGGARVLWGLGALSLIGTCILTESRGGLLASFIGVSIVLAVLVPGLPQKAVAVAAVGALCIGGVVIRTIEQPEPGIVAKPPVVQPAKPPASGPLPKPPPVVPGGASSLPARKDEIGNPTISSYTPTTAGSGRVAEWEGVIDQVRERPLLGYGFGTESRVFIDRWYYFDGGTAENSYLGLLLQLGVIGLLCLLATGLSLVPRAVRAARRLDGQDRDLVVVTAAGTVAAAALMLIQSYIYSVGNVGSVTVWLMIFVLGDLVWVAGRRRPRGA
jgi:hypothetical protein